VQATVTISGGETRTLSAEAALISVGRKPVLEDLGLEKLQIARSRDYIAVNAIWRQMSPGSMPSAT